MTGVRRSRLCKSVSVNGELVPTARLNIHDFATFMREQHLSDKFKSSIQRRASSPNIDSFDITSALRRFRFRSDSEPDSDTEVELSENHNTLTETSTGVGGEVLRVNSNNNDTKSGKRRVASVGMVTLHENVSDAAGSASNGNVSPLTPEPHPLHGMSTGVAPDGTTIQQQLNSSSTTASIKKTAQKSGLCGFCCVVQ